VTFPLPSVCVGLLRGIVPAASAHSVAKVLEWRGKTRAEMLVASAPEGYQKRSLY
jgi:hypothetical protein